MAKPIAHPEWMTNALDSIGTTARLYKQGRIPKSIERYMISIPAMRILKGVYGCRYGSVLWAVLLWAVHGWWTNAGTRIFQFWHFTVLRKTSEEMLAELDKETHA